MDSRNGFARCPSGYREPVTRIYYKSMSAVRPTLETAHPAAVPWLLVELPSRRQVFFDNLRDMLFPRRLEPLDLRSAPAPFWHDVFENSAVAAKRSGVGDAPPHRSRADNADRPYFHLPRPLLRHRRSAILEQSAAGRCGDFFHCHFPSTIPDHRCGRSGRRSLQFASARS